LVNLKRLAALRDDLIFGMYQKRWHPAGVILPHSSQPLGIVQAPHFGLLATQKLGQTSSAWR